MKRCRTVAIATTEVDFMVLAFSSRDSSVLNSLGKHCKESYWKIAVGVDAQPIDIQLVVDKQVALSPEVGVMWNGKRVFPDSGGATKAKLKGDFKWNAPFRGTVKGLRVKDHFEVRPEHYGADMWFPATLVEQREDGLFKASVRMPDGKGGQMEVDYPAVRVENIREAAGMKKPAAIPQRSLVLHVPAKDPLHAVLSVDGGELITHFFARPSPPPSATKQKIALQVSKDRQLVSTDVGHSVLQHFLSGQVRFVRQSASKVKRSWTIQVGPFAEHTIEVEKKHASGKMVTLTVDGTLLCESTGEDIESREGHWECNFRLVGTKHMEWDVHETDTEGNPLDTKSIVTQKTKYTHECVVSLLENEKDMAAAKLLVDDMDVMHLAEYKAMAHEEPLRCSPEALQGSYGLMVPNKVNESVTPLFTTITNNLGEFSNTIAKPLTKMATTAKETAPAASNWFFVTCCSRAAPSGSDDLVVA